MLLIKDNCVATIDYVRFKGTAFVLPMKATNTLIPDHDFDQLWAVFIYSASRTAEEDWHDFGPVDHIKSNKNPDFRQGGDAKGILLLAPGDWSWKGKKGSPTDEET